MKLKIDLSKFKNHDLPLQTLKSLKQFKSFKSFKLPKKMPNLIRKMKSKRTKSAALSLSKRDFVLLGCLVIGLEGYGLYNYLLSPKWQDYSDLQTRYGEDKIVAANFAKDMAQKNQYLEELQLLDYRLNVLTQEIPVEIPQEDIIVTLNKLAQDRELEIKSVSLSTISMGSQQDFAAGKTFFDQNQETGKVTTPSSVNGDVNNSGQRSSTSTAASAGKNIQSKTKPIGNMVLVEDVDLSFSGSYGSLYNFVNDLEQSQRKIIVKEVGMSRESGGSVNGELKLEYVGYLTPGDKSTYSLDTPPIDGKSSPFQAYPGFIENNASDIASQTANAGTPVTEPVKTTNPNFYLILNTMDDNAPKVILGDYTKNGTELYSNVNGPTTGKIKVSGDTDQMTYSYSLGNSTQTKTGKLLIDGGKLRLDVISQQRTKIADKAGITLDIDNETNYPFEINVINDDKNAPRFKLGNKTGIVEMK